MISNLVESDRLSSLLYPDEDVHHVVQDDRHPVVEERLAKDQVVQIRVDANLNQLFEVFFFFAQKRCFLQLTDLSKYSQHCNRINSRDQARKEENLKSERCDLT